jgi:hypothetical protein
MQAPYIKPLPINDNNKVDDSTITLIVVVEGQDILNELMFFYASIDPSISMVKCKNLQSVKVEGSIVDATIKPLIMVVEGQVAKGDQFG